MEKRTSKEVLFFSYMKCGDIIKYLEAWAPKEIAWQKDNVGLQVGSPDHNIKNILLCLELNREVVKEALKKRCNLIVTHHPLLFKPLQSINISVNETARLVEELIKNDITLYSAHTNLDFANDGVSFQLAKALDLKKVRFLLNLKSNQYKLSVFVPKENVETVSNAIFKAGGGVIGEYLNCSFQTPGIGTFKGSSESNPSVGQKEKDEKVEELKLEVLVNAWKLNAVLSEMLRVHPYEQPAFDIYPLNNANVNYGAGAVGELDTETDSKKFLKYVADSLKLKNFRYTEGKADKIKKVAVCGGSGADMLSQAIESGADAFITADIKYHAFHDAEGKILLIDAGHYETEIPILAEIKNKLENFLPPKSRIEIFKYSGSTNPIIFFNK